MDKSVKLEKLNKFTSFIRNTAYENCLEKIVYMDIMTFSGLPAYERLLQGVYGLYLLHMVYKPEYVEFLEQAGFDTEIYVSGDRTFMKVYVRIAHNWENDDY